MGRRDYPPEFRRRVLDLIEAGRKVAEVADDLGISDQTIYTWRRQDRIDRGLEAGLSPAEKAELVAARKRIRELEAELAVHRRATGLLKGGVDQRAVRGHRRDGRRGPPRAARVPSPRRVRVRVLRLAVPATVRAGDPPRLIILEPDAGRAPRPQALADQSRARQRDLRVPRDLPQPPAPPLGAWHAHTRRVRSRLSTNDSGMKSSQPTPRNPRHARASTNPGAVHSGRAANHGDASQSVRQKCSNCLAICG
jgi:transposase